jgi:hypothetical protein
MNLPQRTEVADSTRLPGMPLKQLDLFWAQGISDLKPLQGMPLSYLHLRALWVSDLSLVATMKFLRELVWNSMLVTDLTSLRDLCLKELSVRATGPPI